MGMVSYGALVSIVVADRSMLLDVPDATTVPLVYGTVSQKIKHKVHF